MEPLPPGSGIILETACSEDVLDRNWQRLILYDLAEYRHKGVLTGSLLTDIKITLIAGRAHLKHTEGGDFRQASLRAVRQGLMKAENVLLREDGHAVLSDFGISRITDVRMRQELELTGSCEAGGFGTAYALAPECRDDSVATTASDVYSFGVLMFKVVTGIWYDGSERLFENLKAFAPKWSALLEPMLRCDPSCRPTTAGDLPENPFAGRNGKISFLRCRCGRHALVATVFVLCAILCVIVGFGMADAPQRDGVDAQSNDETRLSPGRIFMREATHFRRLVLPVDGIASIEVPGDFSGTLLTADEVEGELREQVRVVPQSGMRVLYRGNREVVIKRQ